MSDPSIEPTGRSLLNSPWPPRDPFLPGPIQWSQLVALRSIILEPQPFCCDPLSGDPYSGDIWRRHGFILLDLRDHAAYEKGHVPGSCHIPAGELPIRRHEIPPKWRPLLLTTDTPDEGSFAVSFFKGTQHRFIRWISEPTSAWPQEMEAGPSRVPSWEIRPCLHHPSLHHPSRAGNTSTAAALDLACGSGRNAVWLALLGWKVLAVDILPEALEMTRNLAARWGAGVTTQAMNLAKEDPLAPDRFDLIVVTRFLERALFPRMTASLKQGGLLIYDTFTEAQAGKGRPHNPRHWLRRNELRAAFPGLSLLDYAEGADTAGDEIAVLIARKPIPDPDHGSIRRAHREGAKMSQETNSHGPTHPSVPIHLIPEAVGRIVLGAFSMTGVNPLAPQDPIHEEIERQGRDLRAVYSNPSEAGVLLRPARELYRAIGLDPTKRRPSSEALFRRLISGKGLYRVNAVVDTINLCSLRMMLSIGLYDLKAIQGPVQLRIGKTGESYDGIGKGTITVEGRWTLADAVGAFGNPSSDSWRTRITEETRDLLFVAFAPSGYDPEALKIRLEESAETLKTFCGGIPGSFDITR